MKNLYVTLTINEDGDKFFSPIENGKVGIGTKFFPGWISGDGDGVKFYSIPIPIPT